MGSRWPTSCRTCHGAHWIDPVGNRNPEDAEDCPECVAATPQACDDCGRSSEVTDPDPERDGKWLCARCHADRAREVAESC